ncbi:hypothetical protein EBBID32_1110 [Sphingobium indicum BiD32]|uniref:Uncharacterized protein n=1 Tax=Sphingobium indicum BiD32 TaxID=1301087 RepID=N1MK47_9SPHN|nr:hypothetical protein [Sphingobium indicum]CCW15783.1 hypothetical protein EBBID32_1110 [Sphingobium indicum BiD32]
MTDPDIIQAREIVKATLNPDSHKRCNCRAEIDAGQWDRGHKVRASLAGIKRGRALARTCDCAVCASDMKGIVPCVREDDHGQ